MSFGEALSDPYQPLASVYDAWQARYGSFTEVTLAALEPRLSSTRSQISSFLELGCGTGTLLLALGARHPDWRLCGIDGSRAMLAQARRKPGAERVRWHQARLTDTLPLRPEEQFDAAGAFFNTLNHLLSTQDLTRAFRSIGQALRPGARLYFDLNDEAAFELGWQQPHHYVGDGWSVHMDHRWDPADRLARALLQVTTAEGSHTAEVVERCYRHEEITAALTAARFAVEDVELTGPQPGAGPTTSFWTVRRLP
jgi:SAM-dependent methyltransferase